MPTMPPRVSFTMTGNKELQRTLKEMGGGFNKSVLTKILLKRGQPIADMAASKAARRSGDLARSAAVSTQLTPRQQSMQKPFVTPGPYSTQVYIGFGPLPRAHFQEFGTVNHPPHPALRPAWEAGKEAMWTGVTTDLRLHMDRMAAKYGNR